MQVRPGLTFNIFYIFSILCFATYVSKWRDVHSIFFSTFNIVDIFSIFCFATHVSKWRDVAFLCGVGAFNIFLNRPIWGLLMLMQFIDASSLDAFIQLNPAFILIYWSFIEFIQLSPVFILIYLCCGCTHPYLSSPAHPNQKCKKTATLILRRRKKNTFVSIQSKYISEHANLFNFNTIKYLSYIWDFEFQHKMCMGMGIVQWAFEIHGSGE